MESFPLYTDRLLLREYTDRDDSAVLHVMMQPQIYAFTAHIPLSCSRAYAARWIRSVGAAMRRKISYEFAVTDRDTGAYIGNIGVVRADRNLHTAEITYWIDPARQNRGYATEAGRALLGWAVPALKLETLTGCCMAHNAASRRVMEKLGFSFVSHSPHALYKDGAWIHLDHFICHIQQTAY